MEQNNVSHQPNRSTSPNLDAARQRAHEALAALRRVREGLDDPGRTAHPFDVVDRGMDELAARNVVAVPPRSGGDDGFRPYTSKEQALAHQTEFWGGLDAARPTDGVVADQPSQTTPAATAIGPEHAPHHFGRLRGSILAIGRAMRSWGRQRAIAPAVEDIVTQPLLGDATTHAALGGEHTADSSERVPVLASAGAQSGAERHGRRAAEPVQAEPFPGEPSWADLVPGHAQRGTHNGGKHAERPGGSDISTPSLAELAEAGWTAADDQAFKDFAAADTQPMDLTEIAEALQSPVPDPTNVANNINALRAVRGDKPIDPARTDQALSPGDAEPAIQHVASAETVESPVVAAQDIAEVTDIEELRSRINRLRALRGKDAIGAAPEAHTTNEVTSNAGVMPEGITEPANSDPEQVTAQTAQRVLGRDEIEALRAQQGRGTLGDAFRRDRRGPTGGSAA